MSFSNGPKGIVTDGLIFSADAGNAQSYVSGSTTCYNVIPSSTTGSLMGATGAQVSPIYNSEVGGCWDLDGTDDRIEFDYTPILGSNAWTISAWANCTTTDSGYMGAISFGNAAGSECNWLGILDTNYWGGGLFGDNFSTGIAVVTGVWKHLALSYDGASSNGTMKLYMNGIFYATNLGSPNILDEKTRIGGIADSGNYYFGPGKIAAAKIYNRELTQAEIQQNYNSQKARFGL